MFLSKKQRPGSLLSSWIDYYVLHHSSVLTKNIIQTLACGWGVQTSEPIAKGEFIVEYVGEGTHKKNAVAFSPWLLNFQ